MIKNIVFDLGGVIMTIDQSEAVRRFKALGLEDAEARLDPYTQSGIFGELEEGKITAEDFRRELGALVQLLGHVAHDSLARLSAGSLRLSSAAMAGADIAGKCRGVRLMC